MLINQQYNQPGLAVITGTGTRPGVFTTMSPRVPSANLAAAVAAARLPWLGLSPQNQYIQVLPFLGYMASVHDKHGCPECQRWPVTRASMSAPPSQYSEPLYILHTGSLLPAWQSPSWKGRLRVTAAMTSKAGHWSSNVAVPLGGGPNLHLMTVG